MQEGKRKYQALERKCKMLMEDKNELKERLHGLQDDYKELEIRYNEFESKCLKESKILEGMKWIGCGGMDY